MEKKYILKLRDINTGEINYVEDLQAVEPKFYITSLVKDKSLAKVLVINEDLVPEVLRDISKNMDYPDPNMYVFMLEQVD